MKKLWELIRNKRSGFEFLVRLNFVFSRLAFKVSGFFRPRDILRIQTAAKSIGEALDSIFEVDGGEKVMADVIVTMFAGHFGPMAMDDETLDAFLSHIKDSMVEARQKAMESPDWEEFASKMKMRITQDGDNTSQSRTLH